MRSLIENPTWASSSCRELSESVGSLSRLRRLSSRALAPAAPRRPLGLPTEPMAASEKWPPTPPRLGDGEPFEAPLELLEAWAACARAAWGARLPLAVLSAVDLLSVDEQGDGSAASTALSDLRRSLGVAPPCLCLLTGLLAGSVSDVLHRFSTRRNRVVQPHVGHPPDERRGRCVDGSVTCMPSWAAASPWGRPGCLQLPCLRSWPCAALKHALAPLSGASCIEGSDPKLDNGHCVLSR